MKTKSFFVERTLDNTAEILQNELKEVLNVDCNTLRIIERYDVFGLDYSKVKDAEKLFAESFDVLFMEFEYFLYPNELDYLVVLLHDGQYDQRADSAKQCLEVITMGEDITVKTATIYLFDKQSEQDKQKIKQHLINPLKYKEGTLDTPTLPTTESTRQKMRVVIEGFIRQDKEKLSAFFKDFGFAMTFEDLAFVQEYFVKEKRDPTLTELKVIDTYWSDHCRHTTFLTELKDIKIHKLNKNIIESFEAYKNTFDRLYKDREDKYICLMDIATIAAKHLKKEGILDNLDESEEINACSVVVEVDNNGKGEEWLIMFKNETHNHPTEIEPFGGAATCLGGAIRDPLSGRAYVYQAMRITGAGNPLEKYEDTRKNKLPQRFITTTALEGFASYNNQIGLASSIAHELYHDRYKAKRLEAGYVIGGAPRENVVRKTPKSGDVVILVGGATGRDGCGGATSSSRSSTADTKEVCGTEVPSGNPLEERKIQRLFRRKEVARTIIKCNDFGAGGVSVAIGELARGLDIHLDKVLTKYEGLTATELAISESQERMAVVCEKKDLDAFIAFAREENLTATHIATITDTDCLKMYYADELIVDIKRQFLDTNGVKQSVNASIEYESNDYFERIDNTTNHHIDKKQYLEALCYELKKLNNCSQKGIGEVFDSTAGGNSVLMPFGGKLQLVPSMIMASKPPVKGYTNTVTCSSFGIYPELMIQSPYIGAIYSIVLAVNKLVASGVEYRSIRLSLQEYFKRLEKNPQRWGEPLSALLGAFDAQMNLQLAAIGGKDSMSGTYEDIDVPPTLISFAMGIAQSDYMVHNVFGNEGYIYRYSLVKKEEGKPDYLHLKGIYNEIERLIKDKEVNYSAVEESSFLVTLAKSLMGNKTGARLEYMDKRLFMPSLGNIIVVTKQRQDTSYGEYLGQLNDSGQITASDTSISVDTLIESFTSTLSTVFVNNYPTKERTENISYEKNIIFKPQKIGVPKVTIPVFPGTNGEWEMSRAFCSAGAKVDEFVFCNKNIRDIKESLVALKQRIDSAQILALAGGSSAGDEPGGSAKLIAAILRNPVLAESIHNLLQREGLILGIGNGFQALVRLGLLPNSKISEEGSTALLPNQINRNVSLICRTRIASNNSPWLSSFEVGEEFCVPVSHIEGRFSTTQLQMQALIEKGCVATQYVDFSGNATMEYPYNPSGSMCAVEGLLSKDGKILGKMGHTERVQKGLYQNVSGNYDMDIFANGVKYFK